MAPLSNTCAYRLRQWLASYYDGHCPIASGVAIEAVSPKDRMEDVFRTVEEHFCDGAPMVWVLVPTTKTVLVIRRAGGGAILRAGDYLDGEEVVPGFRCLVDDLFRPPPGTAAAP